MKTRIKNKTESPKPVYPDPENKLEPNWKSTLKQGDDPENVQKPVGACENCIWT